MREIERAVPLKLFPLEWSSSDSDFDSLVFNFSHVHNCSGVTRSNRNTSFNNIIQGFLIVPAHINVEFILEQSKLRSYFKFFDLERFKLVIGNGRSKVTDWLTIDRAIGTVIKRCPEWVCITPNLCITNS